MAEFEQGTALHYSLKLPVHSVTKTAVDDFVEVKMMYKTRSVFVRRNRALLLYERSVSDEAYDEVYRKDDFFTLLGKNANYHWGVYDKPSSLLLVRSPNGIEVYQWANRNLTLQYTVSKYHDYSGYGLSSSTMVFGNIFPSNKHIGIVSRVGLDVQFRSLKLKADISTIKTLKKSPVLDEDVWKNPATVISLVEHLDAKSQLSIAVRSASKLQLFRFDEEYELKNIATIDDFPVLDPEYDVIKFAKFDQQPKYNDLLHFSTNGLVTYRYNETVAVYQKMYYSTAFSKLRGWNRRTVETITIMDVNEDAYDELLYTGPTGLTVQQAYTTSDGLDLISIAAVETTAYQTVRYSLLKHAQNLTRAKTLELFFHTSDGIVTVVSEYDIVTKTKPSGPTKPTAPPTAQDPINIPEVVPHHYHAGWLHDQLDLGSLLQPFNPHNGAVEMMLPIVDTRTPFGIPIRKIIQYKNVDYSDVLGRGWSFPLDYIMLDRQTSNFARDHVYSLVKENQRIILLRQSVSQQTPSQSNAIPFEIDGYSDVKFLFYETENYWKVTIDKRVLTYIAHKQFGTMNSCPTWPLCGTLSTNTKTYTTRWYLNAEEDITTGVRANYSYNLVQNGSDLRLESIVLSDDTSVTLSYSEDRITELAVLMHQCTQYIAFHYSADKQRLQSITQSKRKLFDFEYDQQHRMSRIIYPNGAEWTPKYAEIDINPSSLMKTIPIDKEASIYYGPDYIVIVDADIDDGKLVLRIRDPLGGTSTTKSNATKTIYPLSDIKRYFVHALQNLIVVVIIYDSYKDIAILQFAGDSWQQQKYYDGFPMDGIITAGNTFVVVYDQKTLSLLTIANDQQLHERELRGELHANFIVKAFPHGYVTYENGKLEIYLLEENNQWVDIKVPRQSANYFNELDNFINSFAISRELAQSIRRGLLADMLGVYRQVIVVKAPVLYKGIVTIHVRFFTMDLHHKPSICDYYTNMVPYENMNTFTYTVTTDEKDKFTMAYRIRDGKYHLYVKKSAGPHVAALNQYLAQAKKERGALRWPRPDAEKKYKLAQRTYKQQFMRIYQSVCDAVIFALDLSLLGLLTNQEGVLTGNHQITYNGKAWARNPLSDDVIRLRKVNRSLTADYRLLKAHAKDTFKIVSAANGATVFDTNTTKPEELHLIAPHYAQAQPKDHPLRVYFFDSKRTVSFPIAEKLNRASNQLAIVTTLHENDTTRSLLFRCTTYFLNPKLTVLGGQTLESIDESDHTTAYLYDAQDLQLTVDGAIFQKMKIAPGADTARFGWYEQSHDLQTGDTVRKAYASDGREVVDEKLREQEEKRRQSEQQEPSLRQSNLERMILDASERLPIVDLGPYRLADEMVSYYGFEQYEKNHYGKDNRWIFNTTFIRMQLNNRYLSLEQPGTLTGTFTPTEPHQTFVVSCWWRSQNATQLGDTIDTLTVEVRLVNGGERKMTSKPAEVKQRIGDWSYIETVIDTTHFPAETKLTFSVLVSPTSKHPAIDIDHMRFAPLSLPFEANIYEPARGEVGAVLGASGLIKHYFRNGKGKKTVTISEQGTVQEFTMESRVMYARESQQRPCVVEMTPRKSGWFAKYGLADNFDPLANLTKTYDDSWSTLGLRFRYSLSQDAQDLRFFWCNKEFSLPCILSSTASCPKLPKHGEILIFISSARVSVWLDGVLTQEVLLNDETRDAEREFRLQFTGATSIREFIEMYDSTVKVTYHNLAGQPTQVLMYDEPHTLRVREILYDEIERPILQTKWTKVHDDNKNHYFAFIEDFVQDLDNTTLLLTGKAADLHPGCAGYPYTHTVYGNDPTENKQLQGLPGKDYTINGKYKRTYSTRPSSIMLSHLFPQNEGFHHKTVHLPGGAIRVTIEDSAGKKVARFGKVGNYEHRLSTWRYGKNNKLQQELPPMYHHNAHTSTSTSGSFFNETYQTKNKALQQQWEVRYDYDEANNVIRKRTPDGGIYQYLYDSHGILRFSLHKDHNETVDRAIYFTYVAGDKVSREALVHLNETECIRLTDSDKLPDSDDFIETLYGEQDDDPNMRYRSQLSVRRIGDDQMTEYLVFSQEKRLLKKAFIVNAINTSYSIDYEYENDKVRSIKYPIGTGIESFKLIYGYNGNGEIATIRESAAVDSMFEFTYNADGMVETMKVQTDPKHTFQRNFTYNEPGFLVRLEDDYLIESVSYLETESYEIRGIDEASSKKIWDVLREKSFITLDCTNPNLCHGREGRKSLFIDFIQQHYYSHHLKSMLFKIIAKKEALEANTLKEKCERWIEGSNKTMQTCTTLRLELNDKQIIGDSPDNPLSSLRAAFKDALKQYKHHIPDIVRVLGHHFATALGRSAGDVQSYGIDANGNHRKLYTGFSRYRLEYREGTNQITKLYRWDFGRFQKNEKQFNMVHDSDGAVIKAEHKGIKNMEYDKLLQRVNKIEMTDGRTLLYQYDVRAERTFKQVLDREGEVVSEKYYIRDANGLVLVDMEMTYLAKDQPPDVRVTSYIYKDQQLIGFVRNDKLYGVITDHEGSVRLVVRNGEVVAAYDYLPYGQIFRRFGTDLDGQISYLYTGQEWELETELYNYRARLYDPDIGRFYQMDPKEQYPSPYVYAGNSPVALIDPDGELAFAISCIIMAIIGAYIGASSAAQSWNPLQWNWKSTSLWLGLIGGALSGLSIPFNMTASVSYFVGLGLSLTASIGIMVCSGITFGYFALAAASGSWNPANFDLSSPGTWNALLGGIATSSFIVTNPKTLISSFRSITTALGRALFVTTNVVVGATFAYLFGVLKFGGQFDITKWDFTDPGLYLAMIDAYTTTTMFTMFARNVPRNVQKLSKKLSTGLDRLAETQIYFRAKRLMHGDWSSKLSNAKLFMAANAQAIADLQRGVLPIAFFAFFATLRMADSYEKSPIPEFSVFLQIIKTAVTTRGFSNRVVKPLIPKQANTPLAGIRYSAPRASMLVGGPTHDNSTFDYTTSGADTLSSFFSYFRIPIECFRFHEATGQHDATVPRDELVVPSAKNYKNHNKQTSRHGTATNCYRMTDEDSGNGYYVSCYSHHSLVSIYPKDAKMLLEPLLEDHFRFCQPLTYDGMPGLSCDGERSTLFATQTEPPKLFDYVDSWLLLARVTPAAFREGKRIFKRLFGSSGTQETSENRTRHRETMEQALLELETLTKKAAAAGLNMNWFSDMLEDVREDVDEYLKGGRGNANILLERLEALNYDAMDEMDLLHTRPFSTQFSNVGNILQDLADEPKACEEAYRAGEQEEQKHHDERVAKVQEGRGGVLDLQLGGEVVAAVHKQVHRGEAGRQERSPPPVVIFGAQVEVAQQNRRLRAGDHEDQEHQKQKAKHVVHLARPERVQDEEQLDEDAPEREHAAHYDARDGLRVDRLVRDLARYLIRAHWMLQGLVRECG
uniref:Tox-SGS domain-containing protein n=1 Tax=Anopheles dirus TaxID=7168 RepID=A0A182NAT5_9DIPT